MEQISNIFNGWLNLISKNEEVTELAKKRATKCFKCPLMTKGIIEQFIDDEIKEVQGHYCKSCGCPISAKIRSIKSKCPRNLW